LQHTYFTQDSFCDFCGFPPATRLSPFAKKKLHAYKSNAVYRPVREYAAKNGVQILDKPTLSSCEHGNILQLKKYNKVELRVLIIPAVFHPKLVTNPVASPVPIISTHNRYSYHTHSPKTGRFEQRVNKAVSRFL
jgi:hypothetical protein